MLPIDCLVWETSQKNRGLPAKPSKKIPDFRPQTAVRKHISYFRPPPVLLLPMAFMRASRSETRNHGHRQLTRTKDLGSIRTAIYFHYVQTTETHQTIKMDRCHSHDLPKTAEELARLRTSSAQTATPCSQITATTHRGGILNHFDQREFRNAKPLYMVMKRATKASRWKTAFWPNCRRWS